MDKRIDQNSEEIKNGTPDTINIRGEKKPYKEAKEWLSKEMSTPKRKE